MSSVPEAFLDIVPLTPMTSTPDRDNHGGFSNDITPNTFISMPIISTLFNK